MARLTGPLLSIGSRGQIGKTMVTSKWRGIPYMRQYAHPSNPKTNSQTATRSVFSWLNATWKLLDPAVQAPWTLFAKGKPLVDRNAYISKNLAALRGTDLVPATTLAGGVMSPGANAGLASGAFSLASSGAGILTGTLVAPTLPTGWLITAAHMVAFKQQNANTDVDYTSYYATDVSTPYNPALAALPTATYAAFAWFEYTKPDGSTAYSPSLYAAHAVA